MKKLFLFSTLILMTSLNSSAANEITAEKKVKISESSLTCTYVTGNVRTTRGTCAAARSAHIRKIK